MVREAIILAGGRGTRLRSVVSDRPKPLALVAGRPFVEWLILALREQGVRRIALAVGYLGEMFEHHFASRRDLGVEVLIAREQMALGTAGAVRNALSLLNDDSIAVLNGDSYCPFSLAQLETVQSKKHAGACLWLVRVEDGSRFGTVAVDSDGRVTAFQEKRPVKDAALVNAGVYLFRRDILDRIAADRPMSMEHDLLPGLLTEKQVFGVAGDGPFLDIGTPESYQQAGDFLGQTLGALSAKSA